MRLPELKSLARDRGLRNYSRMRKAELVALLQNNGRAPAPPTPPQRCAAYVTLKLMITGIAGFTARSERSTETKK